MLHCTAQHQRAGPQRPPQRVPPPAPCPPHLVGSLFGQPRLLHKGAQLAHERLALADRLVGHARQVCVALRGCVWWGGASRCGAGCCLPPSCSRRRRAALPPALHHKQTHTQAQARTSTAASAPGLMRLRSCCSGRACSPGSVFTVSSRVDATAAQRQRGGQGGGQGQEQGWAGGTGGVGMQLGWRQAAGGGAERARRVARHAPVSAPPSRPPNPNPRPCPHQHVPEDCSVDASCGVSSISSAAKRSSRLRGTA